MNDLVLSVGVTLVAFLLLSLIQCWVMIFSQRMVLKISELTNVVLITKIILSLICGFLWYIGGFIFYM